MSNNNSTFKIQVVPEASLEQNPQYLIGSFQGQTPPNIKSCRFMVSEKSASSRHLKCLTAEDEHILMKGVLNTRPNSKSGLTKYALGVVEGNSIILKDTFMVDFLLTPKTLLNQKRKLTGSFDNDAASANNGDDDDEDDNDQDSNTGNEAKKPKKMTGMEARNLLGETFGSRKKKQEIKAMERNKINVNDLQSSAAFIANSIQEKTVNVPTAQAMEEDVMEDSIVPPFNLDATEKLQMYPISRFMTVAERNSIYFGNLLKLNEQEKKGIANSKTFPSFVATKLSEALMPDIVDEDRIKDLLYLSYLIQFRECKESELNRPSILAKQISHIPPIIVESFFSKFTETFSNGEAGKTKYKLPARLRDKILCYILVLAFRINDFSLCLNDLVSDLKISMDKLVTCCRFVGAKSVYSGGGARGKRNNGEEEVVGQTATRSYKLEAPLTFPKPRLARKTK